MIHPKSSLEITKKKTNSFRVDLKFILNLRNPTFDKIFYKIKESTKNYVVPPKFSTEVPG